MLDDAFSGEAVEEAAQDRAAAAELFGGDFLPQAFDGTAQAVAVDIASEIN